MSEVPEGRRKLSKRLGILEHNWSSQSRASPVIDLRDDDATPYQRIAAPVHVMSSNLFGFPTDEDDITGMAETSPNRTHATTGMHDANKTAASSGSPGHRMSIPIRSGNQSGAAKPSSRTRSGTPSLELSQGESFGAGQNSAFHRFPISRDMHKAMDESTEQFERNLASTRPSRSPLNVSTSDSLEHPISSDSVRFPSSGPSNSTAQYSGKLAEKHLFPATSPKKGETRPVAVLSSSGSPIPINSSHATPTTPTKAYRVAKATTAAGMGRNAQRQLQAVQSSPPPTSSSYRPSVTTLPVVQSSSKKKAAEASGSSPSKSPSVSAVQPPSKPPNTREKASASKIKGNDQGESRIAEKESAIVETPESLWLTDSQIMAPPPSSEEMFAKHSETYGTRSSSRRANAAAETRASSAASSLSLSMEVDEPTSHRENSKKKAETKKETVMIDDDEEVDDEVLKELTTNVTKPAPPESPEPPVSTGNRGARRNLFAKSNVSEATSKSTSVPLASSASKKSSASGERKKEPILEMPLPTANTTADKAATATLPKHGLVAAAKAGSVLLAPIPKKSNAAAANSRAKKTTAESPSEEQQTPAPSKRPTADAIDNILQETLGTTPTTIALPKATSSAKKKRTGGFDYDYDYDPDTRPGRSLRARKGPATIDLIELSDDDDDEAPVDTAAEAVSSKTSKQHAEADESDQKRYSTRSSTRPNTFSFSNLDSNSQIGNANSSLLLPLTISSELSVQQHFHLSYYQDDVGRGHVALDAPDTDTEHESPSASRTSSSASHSTSTPTKSPKTAPLPLKSSGIPHETKALQYDSRLSFSINRDGIFIWKVLPLSKKKAGSSHTPKPKKTESAIEPSSPGAKESTTSPEKLSARPQGPVKLDQDVHNEMDGEEKVDTEPQNTKKRASKRLTQTADSDDVIVISSTSPSNSMDVEVALSQEQSQEQGRDDIKRTRTSRRDTVAIPQSTGKSKAKKSASVDVDTKSDEETQKPLEEDEKEAKEESHGSSNAKRSPGALKQKPKEPLPTHELLAYIPSRRIVCLDVFAEPGLFFIFTSAGPSMSVLPPSSSNSTALSTDSPSLATPALNDKHKNKGSTPKSSKAITTSEEPNRKKRKRGEESTSPSLKISKEVEVEVEEEGGRSTRSKRRKSAPSPSPIFTTPSNSSEHDKDNPTNNVLDLSYEVDPTEEGSTSFLDTSGYLEVDDTITDPSDESGSTTTKKRVSETPESSNTKETDLLEKVDNATTKPSSIVSNCKTVDADSCRLFVIVCDRDDLHCILNQFMELSDFLSSSTPCSSSASATTSEDSKMDVDEEKPSTSKSPASTSAFEIFGRNASLKPIPADLAQLWWKPDLVAEADKNSSATLKSPASKLKSPVHSQSASQRSSTPASVTTLPMVYSKRTLSGDNGKDTPLSADEVSLRKQSQHRYCSPFPLENTAKTMDLIRNGYDKVRESIFGGAWPVCCIFPSLRGLFASSIANAPRLYISPPSRLFHHSTLPKPPEETIQLKSGTNSKAQLAKASIASSESTIIIFPPLAKKTKSGEKDEALSSGLKMDSVCVRQLDVDRLQPGVFLNDNLVDFYLKYIQLRLMGEESRKRVKIFSSHFFTLLSEQGYDRVSGWTQKQNMFDLDFIIVPINMHLHWKVAVICNPGNAVLTYSERQARLKKLAKQDGESAPTEDKEEDEYDVKTLAKNSGKSEKKLTVNASKSSGIKASELIKEENSEKKANEEKEQVVKRTPMDDPRQSCILVLDSLGSKRDARVSTTLREFMKFEARKWKREVAQFDTSNMTAYHPNAPQQNNFTDCGLFLLHYMEKFCLDLPKDVSKDAINALINEDWFPPEEVDGKRRRIANCIDELVKEEEAARKNTET